MKNTGAVIVAAGLSRRMQAFKPMLPLGNSTLILRTVQGFLDAGVKSGNIAVITGRNAQALSDHVTDLHIHCLHNSDYEINEMLDSAKIGFSFMMAAGCRRVFFTPGDIPCFLPDTLLSLNGFMEETGAWVVKPCCESRAGHPVLLNGQVLPLAMGYCGEMGLKGFFRSLGDGVRLMECRDPGILMDADTPEDYTRLKAFFEGNLPEERA